MADALASGASGSNTVWVQVPSLALNMERAGRKTCLFQFEAKRPCLSELNLKNSAKP